MLVVYSYVHFPYKSNPVDLCAFMADEREEQDRRGTRYNPEFNVLSPLRLYELPTAGGQDLISGSHNGKTNSKQITEL